ncbi:MAG TPA: hypothetical protein VK826_13675 [Bacteroidia bacterium]|nr:hypothetical protein [Bacteroidia bacterium]
MNEKTIPILDLIRRTRQKARQPKIIGTPAVKKMPPLQVESSNSFSLPTSPVQSPPLFWPDKNKNDALSGSGFASLD